MAQSQFNNNSFHSMPILLTNNENNKKKLSIPIKFENNVTYHKIISRSWNDYIDGPIGKKYLSVSPNHDHVFHLNNFKPYDAINNCKSAGIIPYTIYNDTLLFLFQKAQNPHRKKDYGWNDFGGKKIDSDENTIDTAAREFSEETSCLFYLHEQTKAQLKQLDMAISSESNSYTYSELYSLLKNNDNLIHDATIVQLLKQLIPLSQKYFMNKITEFVLPIHISSKETYISYFVKVDYIPSLDLPNSEDIHITYENRYIRQCKWISFDELMNLDEKDFHKRLQITRIKQRIYNYHGKKLFT